MNSNRNIAILVGVLFILAAVTSIIGLLLYDPILNDSNYIINAVNHTPVMWGAFFEVLAAFSIIGTSLALYPVLKRYNTSMALACVAFRLLEATLIIIGILCLLTIITLNHEFSTELNSDISSYRTSGKLLLTFHNWTFLYGPNLVLGPSTFMTSFMLYKLKLVPRFICYLGLIGGPLISLCAVLVTFGLFLQISTWGALLAVPVFFYEMSLAIWVLAKGFNSTPVVSAPVQNLFKLAAKARTTTPEVSN